MDFPAAMGEKILIVDDDQNHVLLLKKRLQAAGYQTMVASDGVEGLSQAVHQRPDLIITDVLLPRMNGFQLAERLKSNPETENIPIIMMSSVYVTDEDMQRGFELGAETYVAKADLALRKPLQEEELLKATALLLGKAEAADAHPPSRVLVVEDDAGAARLIRKRLLPESFQVDTAPDGEEALAKIAANSFDAVLLDIKLPRLGGLDVLEQVRDSHPGLAVVMMTAYGSESIAAEALRRGADDYLIKPLENGEPAQTLRIALEKKRRRRELAETGSRLRGLSVPEEENKKRLIEELRASGIALMDQYNRLLKAEEKNREYAEQLEHMVDERTRDLQRRTRDLSILHAVLTAGTRSHDLAGVLQTALEQIDKMIPMEASAAFIVEQETRRLRLGAQKDMPADFLRWVSRTSGGEGVFGQVLRTGRDQLVTDLTRDIHLGSFFTTVTDVPSMIVFPMTAATEVVGLVVGIFPREQKLDGGVWRLLDSIGVELGVVVENVRLYENLTQAYLSTIRALAEAVDAKDAYTRGHSDKVSAYAVAIARHMQLDSETVQNIRDSGYLHDIGKIGTPDAVLLKKGVLTFEEMSTMKLHPDTSHKILEQARIPAEVKDIIRHHHERFDGGGYPDGLAGEEIPLGSRILSVADAFDAMTSERPYRLPFSQAEAIAELKRCVGDQFDPEVVEAFLGLAGDLGTIQAEAAQDLKSNIGH